MTHWRALLLTLTLALNACSSDSGDSAKGRSAIILEPCRLEGVPVAGQCGKFAVFEDRAAHSGPRIDIHVAIVPAVSAEPRPDPIVFFAGGPGQSFAAVRS